MGQWAKSTPTPQDTPSQHAPARIPHAHPTCTHCLMLLVRGGQTAGTWGGGGGGGVSWHGVDGVVPLTTHTPSCGHASAALTKHSTLWAHSRHVTEHVSTWPPVGIPRAVAVGPLGLPQLPCHPSATWHASAHV